MNGAGTPRVSAATQQRVREAVRELGYRTNATAKALRERVAELIGFIGDEVASAPFAGEMVEGAQERAWQDGQLMVVVNTNGRAEIESSAVEQMLSHQVRRFVYASMYNRPVTIPEGLRGYEVVIINAIDPSGSTWSVSPDEATGGREATEHLLAAGHRRIGMIDIETLESGLPAAVGRYQGYVEAIEAVGLRVDPSQVRFGGGGPEHGYIHALSLLDGPEPPTAIFCANDRTAWGAYQALQERGLRIPDDISIAGFDNQETLAPWLRPALTTMNLPFREMGWAAADLLLTGGARNGGSTMMRLHCDLVSRDSVAPPRGGA
ncbi:LacI family DNA-binding transcriptional regulator [Actinotalea sp. K2]|nr:LacI family DNA-binding transcriptional regulator [Actinotalea sp. K2]